MILPNTKHSLPNMEQYVLFKGHLLTAEGQHILSCNTLFSGRNIPLKTGIYPMLRGHMKCCPPAVNIFLLKGNFIQYLVRNVWYMVRNMWLPSRCNSHSPSAPYTGCCWWPTDWWHYTGCCWWPTDWWHYTGCCWGPTDCWHYPGFC